MLAKGAATAATQRAVMDAMVIYAVDDERKMTNSSVILKTNKGVRRAGFDGLQKEHRVYIRQALDCRTA